MTAVVHLPSGPVVGAFDGHRGVVSVAGVELPLRHRRGTWLATTSGAHVAVVVPLQGVSAVGVERLLSSHAPKVVRTDTARQVP